MDALSRLGRIQRATVICQSCKLCSESTVQPIRFLARHSRQVSGQCPGRTHRIYPLNCEPFDLSDPTAESSPSNQETVATKVEPLEVSLSPQERFSEYLQTRGLRQTSQRKFLIDQVFSQHDHFDAEELIERLPRRGEDNYVSTATVYRTLRECVDAGLLNSFQLDGRTVYDHDYGYPQHDHLYCTRCRKLLEFQSDELLAIRDQTAAVHGFRVEGHRMIINGVCRECSRSRRKKRKQDLV